MTATFGNHPYAGFLHEIEKPVRYIGGEHGSVRKDWSAARARIALAFPDVYDIGMSHLGFKILYGVLNAHPALIAERVYAPWSDMERALRDRALPLVSLESAHALAAFDVVGFSLQFELTYTNVLLMLDLGGIALRSADRDESAPLVIAGGPTATHPEPLAPFIDAFVIGDGERIAVELALAWATLRDAGMPRRERLVHLAKMQGVYVPQFYETTVEPSTGMTVVDRAVDTDVPARVSRAHVANLDEFPFPSDGPVASTETVFDRVSVEIARGCTEGCRFCQAGMIYRPVRERSPESILQTLRDAIRRGGYDEVSLTSLSTADYACIAPLVRRVMQDLENDKVSLSVSSLRAYGLTEDLLDEIQKVRATGLTFAPEAGTQRMRDVVNKNVTEEQLLETAERVFTRGWSKMKLYFMIGLPTETDEDVLGIVDTGRRTRDVGRRAQKGRPPKVTVSVSTHVPKPHTPFQWCALDTLESIQRKQSLLREAARSARVDLRMHESRGSTLEGVLARGDRRLADVVEGAYRRGARFDSWEERLEWSAWLDAFAECGIEPAMYLGTIPLDARLPWDHIDVGLADGFLAKEYRKALRSRLSPPCGKAVGQFVHHTNTVDAELDRRKLVCYDCGVACDLTAMRDERLVALRALGATERRSPPPPAPPTTTAAHENDEAEAPGARERVERRPRVKFTQAEARRYRIGFTRTGRAAFNGHLDLVRLVPRIVRRASLDLRYSQGFHPKPELVFGPALALGIATLDEYVDIKLTVDVDPDSLVPLLQRSAPEGLTFVRARRLDADELSVAKLIEVTEYTAALARGALRDAGFADDDDVNSRIAERATLRPLAVVRRGGGGIGKSIDVGSKLLRVEPGVGKESLAAAELVGDLYALTFATRSDPSGTCKPSEVVRALFDADLPARFVRTRQGRLDADGAFVTAMEAVLPPPRATLAPDAAVNTLATIEPLPAADENAL